MLINKFKFFIIESTKRKDPIFSEIASLKYILEDEGYKVYYRKGMLDEITTSRIKDKKKEIIKSQSITYFDSKHPEIHSDQEEKYILYVINITSKDTSVDYGELDQEDRIKLSKKPEYEEFIERLREFCSGFGYQVEHLGDLKDSDDSYDAIMLYKGFDKNIINGDYLFIVNMTIEEMEELEKYNKLLECKKSF